MSGPRGKERLEGFRRRKVDPLGESALEGSLGSRVWGLSAQEPLLFAAGSPVRAKGLVHLPGRSGAH